MIERPGLDVSRFSGDSFPVAPAEERASEHLRPLPEDFVMQGLSYVGKYHPQALFAGHVEEERKLFEASSMMESRKERILFLGFRIARLTDCLVYDEERRRFSGN